MHALDIDIAKNARQIEIFCRADATPGPHPISRTRLVKNEIHRLFSIKAGMRDVLCESPLEADAIVFEEGQSNVVSICEQSPRINGAILNKPYYTFDYTVKYLDCSTLNREVKESSRLILFDDGRQCPPGWAHIEAWCRCHGEACGFITEIDLEPHRQLIANWRMLLPFARRAYEEPDPPLEKSILSHVLREGQMTVQQLHAVEASAVTEQVMNYIAKLLHQGHLTADLHNAPISLITTVSIPEQDSNRATL